MKQLVRLVSACALASTLATSAQAQVACEFVEIDPLYSPSASVGALNNRGQVVGTLDHGPGYGGISAFVWEHGVTRELPTFTPGQAGGATAINDRGEVAGYILEGEGFIPVAWTARGIRRLRSGGIGFAYDINKRGQIVGSRGESTTECLLWPDAESEPIVLGGLGGVGCVAYAINDHGEIAGTAAVPNGDFHAFIWKDGVFTDIGPRKPAGDEGSFFRAQLSRLNKHGEGLGGVSEESDFYQFVYTRAGEVRRLPEDASASTINDKGVIAATTFDAESHLLLLDVAGNVQDKGTLGGLANGGPVVLNERNELAWTAFHPDGTHSAYFCKL